MDAPTSASSTALLRLLTISLTDEMDPFLDDNGSAVRTDVAASRAAVFWSAGQSGARSHLEVAADEELARSHAGRLAGYEMR